MKVNVGCGERKMHGFINIDSREEVSPDIVCDVAKVHEVISGADLVYASHILEHFPSNAFKPRCSTWIDALTSWYTALNRDGVLRVCVPDFEKVCEYYTNTSDIHSIRGFLYGGQRNQFDFHFHCWDFDSLASDLSEVGFRSCKRYDWRETEHYYVDDYSQAYLPHMDKSNGLLMSLNVEARK